MAKELKSVIYVELWEDEDVEAIKYLKKALDRPAAWIVRDLIRERYRKEIKKNGN